MLNCFKVRLFRLLYRRANRRAWKGRYPEAPVSQLQLPTVTGPIRARVYASTAEAASPVILYFHGGGWVIGDLESHHPFCQFLARHSHATVVAIDYRLAPEHPYPACTEDCLAAAEWVAANLDAVGPNNGSLVIAGDSAGGYLVATTCLALSAQAGERLAGAITLCPVTDHYSRPRPSHRERATAKPLTLGIMKWFWNTWLGTTPVEKAAPTPLQRSDDLQQMPPLFNVTAEFDVLRDEGRAFSEAVRQAGVKVEHHHYDNATHGFACSEGPTDDCTLNMDRLESWLRRLPPRQR